MLLSCQNLAKSFGARVLFKGLSFGLAEAERVGVIGPNGAGKSTLVKMLAGLEEADSGQIALRQGLKVIYVAQDPNFAKGLTVAEVLTQALKAHDEHEALGPVTVMLGIVGFKDPEARVDDLSGGWLKRLAIAQALIQEPELLFLDEPTNHLDLEGIVWLESLLKQSRLSLVLISHDRAFLASVATRIVEINPSFPQGLFSVDGNYEEFQRRRAELLHAQAKTLDAMENQMRRETEWLRAGVKARTTKSRARIDAAYQLSAEVAEIRIRSHKESKATIDFSGTPRKTKKLLAAKELGMSRGGRELFSGLTFTLGPGVRLGLLGTNGSGKSTLLKILGATLSAEQGVVERADGVVVITFEQHRDSLEPSMTVAKALAPHGDSVLYRGRSVHVASYARGFLFNAEQLKLEIGALSGGEKARLRIAQLMLEPCDVLLLDEPTNDLDIPTLEVLEESLNDFPGAIVLVTHDRYLLDRVATVLLGLGDGEATLLSSVSQWESLVLEKSSKKPKKTQEPDAAPTGSQPSAKSPQKIKLSYNEQREWDQMEAKILAAEDKLAACQAELESPEYALNASKLAKATEALHEAEKNVEQLYARWGELEAKRGGS